jgi:murein DD-endopeptidase MepM/ murein hydrolase activator NlpD
MKNTLLARFLICTLLALGPALFAEELIHVLQKGETLFAVSRRYNVPPDAIMRFNGIADPDRLKAGQKLKIPNLYTVQKGDTLYGIARKLSVPVDTLLAANKLSKDDTLKAGQSLYVPAVSTAGVSTAVAKAPAQTTAQSAAPASDPSPSPAPVSDIMPQKPLEDPRSFETKKVDSSIIWPVQAKEVSYLSGKVYGVSIASSRGERVKAITSGTVLSIGPYRGFGQVVFLQAKTGYIYVYGGLDGITPHPGQALSFGDEIGTIGSDSLSGQPRLYFMVYNKDIPVDPAKAPRGY